MIHLMLNLQWLIKEFKYVLIFAPFFFQSLHSGCENDPIDLEGLHESVVDSDEDLADSMDVSIKLKVDKSKETFSII